MASKREDKEGDIIDLLFIKCKINTQEGGDVGALLSVIPLN